MFQGGKILCSFLDFFDEGGPAGRRGVLRKKPDLNTPAHGNFASIRCLLAGQDPEKGGLSRPIGSHQPHSIPHPEAGGTVREEDVSPIGFLDFPNLKNHVWPSNIFKIILIKKPNFYRLPPGAEKMIGRINEAKKEWGKEVLVFKRNDRTNSCMGRRIRYPRPMRSWHSAPSLLVRRNQRTPSGRRISLPYHDIPE